MIIAAALVFQQTHFSHFEYGGLPAFTSTAISIQGANIGITLAKRMATVDELLVLKNTSAAAVDTTVSIPRLREGDGKPATFAITATCKSTKLPLIMQDSGGAGGNVSPLGAPMHFGAGETIGLRVQYTTAFGSAGYGGNQSVVGFSLDSSQAKIAQVNVAFHYSQQSVFGLPTLTPELPWQIGTTGTSVRLIDFAPAGQRVVMKFYNGGYRSIR